MTLEIARPRPAEAEPLPPRAPTRRLSRRLRRLLGRALAQTANAFFPTPLGRWLHRRLGPCEENTVEIELSSPAAQVQWPRIAFLSDLHAGYYMTTRDLEGLAERINAMQPDLVCLGGDLVNHHVHELEVLAPALRRLRAPLGVFAVPGNHDYAGQDDVEDWSARLEQLGVSVLLNRGVRLRFGAATFWLCGVDDLTEGVPSLVEALAGRAEAEPSILVSHHPDLFAEAEVRGVDLQLSGHTHGGQIRLGDWVPVHHSRFRFVGGLYATGASRLYVGRGAGVTALPFRIGTRSEITLLRPRALGGERAPG